MKYRAQFPCRCRHCRARKTLPMRPEHYLRRQPRCWNCGLRGWRVDRYRHCTEHQRYACDCRGIEGIYDFKGAPHRRGSLYCVHGKATDEQVALRMGWKS